MPAPLFKGVITALITPFRNGKVDFAAFEALVERQIAAGVHGLTPVGTTGESATLTVEERHAVVEACVRVAAGRVRVVGTKQNECPSRNRTNERCGPQGAW